MLVKHEACSLNNTESFLYTVSCNIDIVECIIVIGKDIQPIKHAIFCLLSLCFALNNYRSHIQVSVYVLLFIIFMFQKGTF